ncbi:putative ribonuclease H-like domain-containing protein [Tanacetum coccineum]
MSIPVTAKEKTNKKNDVKARSFLLIALPNEHQLTFSQYPDAKSMFAAIETRFKGNTATKKTQTTLFKQQYENFSASSAESLDSIFNRLQKIVSRLAILGVVVAQEDLNLKILSSLPPRWNTHVVLWMNKPEVETMSMDDLYYNFKIVEQKIKKSVGASSGAQNLAFMTAPRTSSTNDANTASPQVSTTSPIVNAASLQVSTTSVSNNVVYAFMVENPNGSNVLHQDLEQIHKDDLEAMDLKWQLSLLSVRVKKYYQRIVKKIFINANDIVGYDKSKVECYNCHKLRHFARECRAPRSKEGQFRNQDNTRKQGNNEDKSSKAMLAIYDIDFYWSDMAEEQVQTNMALMAFSDSENEVLFSKEVVVLKREVACKDYEINVLKSEFEKVKQEKDDIEFKIEKFDKASKDLDQLLGSQITDKSKKGLGYSAVPPPHPLIYNRPKKLDLSYSGLDEFKEPEFKGYGPENKQVSQDTSSFVESLPNVDKETVFLVNKKVEFTKPKNHENQVKKSVRLIVITIKEKGIVSRNNYNRLDAKTTHPSVHRNMYPRAVLLKTGLTPLNTVRPVNIAHPKLAVHSAKSKSHFSKQAQSTAQMPFYKQTTLTRRYVHTATRHYYTGKPRAVNTASGCSRHMTGNIAYLSDFKEFDRGYVAFGGGAYGGRITGKGTLKTDNLDFEDVYFVNELKFNLFSVSQMCDKKNYVLFTDTECLVLSPNFKLPDENQILLKIPRKDNMYSFDMKNIVPKESLTCLVAKATLDESMLWHRRLGHINFKNINKLVKDNLVRGLPTKCFENDQTCVACLKGKQHRASCLTWYYLLTKDETSEIFKNFIKEIENLVDKKVKIIKSDNGTEFKNKVMDDFCREKGIKRKYSVSRTPQQNGVVERRNKTLIEAARTMDTTLNQEGKENLHIEFLEKKPMIEDNVISEKKSVSRLALCANLKDTSYFDLPTKDVENGEPKTADDAQKQVEDSPNNENIELTSIAKALSDSSWVEAMQEELLQFKLQQVWILVDLPSGKRAIGGAWYETLANYLLGNGFKRGKIDQILFIKKQKGDILLVQIYVDDIIFGSTNKELCTGFEKLIKDKFQMSSMGELTLFLGLQVQQKEDGIFISQDKYVAEILKKFNYTDVKSASTPVDLEKPLVKDGDADDVDVHLYRSMIRSLMYLTASRPDIMFVVCACARFQVTPKTSHLLAVKRIFRYLKGKPTLGLWYSRDSPFELVAYTDSDYAGATQDRKSTTRDLLTKGFDAGRFQYLVLSIGMLNP